MTEDVYLIQMMQREIKYHQETTETLKEIVRQLSGEDLGYEYIHPYDLYHLVNEAKTSTLIEFLNERDVDFRFTIIDGVKYKQSALMPSENVGIK